jgi:hypothetical protein
MSRKSAYIHYIVCILFILFTLSFTAVAGAQSTVTPQPSQALPGDIRGAVVTLYYYDPVTEEKGAMVPLPDDQNPQVVEWDYTKAAPGTYTFYKVPQGTYYVEAVHGNNSYFAIAYVGEGTTTNNIAIPLNSTEAQWQPVNENPVATVTATPTPTVTASPSPATVSPPSPGMTTFWAIAGLTIVALYIVYRKE